MHVRDARGADVETIRRIAERSWERDYPDFLTRETIASGVLEWYNAESVRADLANPDSVLLVAADDEDRPIGFAHGHRSGDVGSLLRVYVDPDHRREGVATALVDAVGDAFAAAGVSRVRAMALAANEPGCAFYRSLGMERVDTRTTTIGGEEHDEAVFEREGST